MDSEETAGEPESAALDPESSPTPRPGLGRSTWHGAKVGFRIASWGAGLLVAVFVVFSLALTVFGMGSGRGFGLQPVLFSALGAWAVTVLWGIVIGAVIGLIVGVITRARPGVAESTWYAAARRPIRFPWKRQASAALEAGFSRPRRRTWIWSASIFLLLVLTAALGAGLFLGWMVDHRLATATGAADRDDPYWRLDDLMAHRQPVPDAENSALVVAEVLWLLPEGWPGDPPPSPGTPRGPESEVLRAYTRMSETPENVRLEDAVATTLRDSLAENGEAVELARTVANYDRGRHEIELGPTLLDTPLPETQAARGPARFLVADAAIRAHDGDLDGALDSCRAALGVGRSIGDEPMLISQLVRVAIGGVAMKSARRVLGQGEPSDEALARLQALILDELEQPLLIHGLRGERATQVELIRRIGAGEIPISALSSGGPPFDPKGPLKAIAPWGKLMFENQRAVALEWLNEAVRIARQPGSLQSPLWAAWEAEIQRVKRTWHGPFDATLPLLMTPALSACKAAHDRYRAELGSLAILLAAERHRQKTGNRPDSIAAIDPTILPKTPLDPYTGGPFRLLHRDGQFFIYSVGANHKDEQGGYDVKQARNGKLDDVGASAWDVPLRRQPAPPRDEPATDPEAAAAESPGDSPE